MIKNVRLTFNAARADLKATGKIFFEDASNIMTALQERGAEDLVEEFVKAYKQETLTEELLDRLENELEEVQSGKVLGILEANGYNAHWDDFFHKVEVEYHVTDKIKLLTDREGKLFIKTPSTAHDLIAAEDFIIQYRKAVDTLKDIERVAPEFIASDLK